MLNKQVLIFKHNTEIVKRGKRSIADYDYDHVTKIVKRVKLGGADKSDGCHGPVICNTSELINDKYKIIKKVGKGTFGRVQLAQNVKTGKQLALKIMKNKNICKEQGEYEIMVLKYISHKDSKDSSLCLKMFDSFEHNGHICIAFEALGLDVFHFLKMNSFHPFPLNDIRHFAYQMCYAVNFLHTNGITHTDLKLDNVLFVDSSYTKSYCPEKKKYIRLVNRTDIRLIDFGSAVFDKIPNRFTISNRYYRAPEVILKLGWSQPVDVWAIGCLLFEIYTGEILFPTADNDLDHLEMILQRLGSISYEAPQNTISSNGKFDYNQNLYEGNYKDFREYWRTDSEDALELLDLIEKMLVYEPSNRINLEKALWHPFFTKLPSNKRLM